MRQGSFLVKWRSMKLELKVIDVQDDLSHINRTQGFGDLRSHRTFRGKSENYWPSNVTWTTSVVSFWDVSNFHFPTASTAASTSTGFPPSTRVVLTLPFARTTASTRTTPWICIFFASSG